MSESPTQQLVVFSLGSEEYALPVGTVHEIIRYSEPRALASEEPCTIYGMPRAVAEAGLADHVLPLHELGAAIAREVAS